MESVWASSGSTVFYGSNCQKGIVLERIYQVISAVLNVAVSRAAQTYSRRA